MNWIVFAEFYVSFRPCTYISHEYIMNLNDVTRPILLLDLAGDKRTDCGREVLRWFLLVSHKSIITNRMFLFYIYHFDYQHMKYREIHIPNDSLCDSQSIVRIARN